MTFIAMRDGASLVDVASIQAIEWFTLSLQTSDARVIVTLQGGRTVGEYFGQHVGADERAKERFDEVTAEVRALLEPPATPIASDPAWMDGEFRGRTE